ncbi:hypothetical protein RFI_11633, partial [Reticulomyxa filosa]
MIKDFKSRQTKRQDKKKYKVEPIKKVLFYIFDFERRIKQDKPMKSSSCIFVLFYVICSIAEENNNKKKKRKPTSSLADVIVSTKQKNLQNTIFGQCSKHDTVLNIIKDSFDIGPICGIGNMLCNQKMDNFKVKSENLNEQKKKKNIYIYIY